MVEFLRIRSSQADLLEEKIGELIIRNEQLVEDIKGGNLVFSDNSKILKFSRNVTEYLVGTYRKNRALTGIEITVLDKLLDYHGVNNIHFCLLSDINLGDREFVLFLERNNFKLLENVGYINTV
ncbi:hypothetical protein QTG56_26040 (plasmid) [Rossellomorea sp. AcN35-11]|nr:hypothetical protein [Rossellomorea aquimaris]WJV32078.1 hypothetical protein QTG56_26040 [Rossellomorea sp. AcN35-11]